MRRARQKGREQREEGNERVSVKVNTLKREGNVKETYLAPLFTIGQFL